MARLTTQQRTSLTILVAALGYFVDVFDIQLFGIVRTTSLKSLGLTGDQITSVGAMLLNWQMAGMLLGGILWGILGDKKGRVYVLFGTILLYSVANIANAFVDTIPAYAATRFFSGLGLAGEIGAGVTLASELLPKNIRSYATTIVISFGVMGPIVASFVVEAFDWRTAYIVGGALGIVLLLFRVSVNESGLFAAVKKETHISRGRFFMLFNNRRRLAHYLCCIAIGATTYIGFGILAIFSPEIGTALNIAAPIKASTAMVSYFIGNTLGALLSGLLSQVAKSRKKILAGLLIGGIFIILLTLHAKGMTASAFYILTLITGALASWTIFMTTTAEQFGTNLRATATTTAPNFARASIILYTFLIGVMKASFGLLSSIEIIALIGFALAGFALWRLPETFGRDLDFTER